MEKARENGTRLNKYLVGFPRGLGGRLHLNFQYSNQQQENAYNFCSFLNHFLTGFPLRIPGFAPCDCGKGKGRDVEEGRVLLLDSPITLGRDIDEGSSSDDSYRTPLAGSSIPPVSSSSGSSEEQALILYDSRDFALIEIHKEIVESHRPVPIPSPCLDTAGIARLIAVRGQRAVRTLGRPKSTFHPYACCSIGERCSTHRPGRLCSRGNPTSGTSSSRGRNSDDEGSPVSESSSRMGGDGGGADGGGQQRRVGLGWKQR